MMTRLTSLARNAAGSVTIELALLAPLLASMLIGLVDVSTAYAHKLRLEQIAQRIIEQVQAKGFDPTDVAALETEAETAAGTGSNATATYWLECTTTAGVKTKPAYTAGCPDGQFYARYVQLDMEQKYTPFIMAKFSKSNTDGTITVHGIAGIRFQ